MGDSHLISCRLAGDQLQLQLQFRLPSSYRVVWQLSMADSIKYTSKLLHFRISVIADVLCASVSLSGCPSVRLCACLSVCLAVSSFAHMFGNLFVPRISFSTWQLQCLLLLLRRATAAMQLIKNVCSSKLSKKKWTKRKKKCQEENYLPHNLQRASWQWDDNEQFILGQQQAECNVVLYNCWERDRESTK